MAFEHRTVEVYPLCKPEVCEPYGEATSQIKDVKKLENGKKIKSLSYKAKKLMVEASKSLTGLLTGDGEFQQEVGEVKQSIQELIREMNYGGENITRNLAEELIREEHRLFCMSKYGPNEREGQHLSWLRQRDGGGIG